jgi:DNA polymerase I-like protein with 3'-5' exonuclease and polymerase domains/uracil-DNA glycosylase
MTKPHAVCAGCPRENSTSTHQHQYVGSPVPSDADLVIIAEAPVCDRYGNVPRAFQDDGGKIIRTAVDNLRRLPEYKNLNVAYTYAVLCTSNQGDTDPPKTVLTRCRTMLQSDLLLIKKQPVLLVMGMTALRALEIKAAKLKDMQGRLLPQQVVGNMLTGERRFDTVVTISTKQLVAMPGVYTTFLADLKRAADAARTGGFNSVPALDALTQNYKIPRTVEEVKAICREIIDYTEGNVAPENWPISVDTETNTKFPHRDKLRVLAVSFAWAEGKATAIPLWHPAVEYNPEDVLPYLLEVLACKKPKFFHNAKFDLKVFMKVGWELINFVWDSMTGEHVLEEDKKGQYGLKPLTRTFFPDFASYADALHEILTKEEGDSQLHNLRKALKSTVGGGRKKKAAEKDGGFEKIPLATLLLYAAVDADMTRRLVLLQEKRLLAEQNKVIGLKNALGKEQAVHAARGIPTYPIPNLSDAPKPVRRLAIRNVFPVTPVLAKMEFQGIRIDRPYLTTLQNDLGKVVQETTDQLFAMAGGELKLNSPAEIARVLFDTGFIHPETGVHTKYPLTGVTKTKKGQTQTTEKVMQFLVAKYGCPFASKKLIYAKAFKAKNTFCQNVWDLSELDGYLHTNYNQHGTNSGRLSSNDENMQNIPKKLAGVNIKKVFIPDDESYLFVNADAKGAEVRILTAYCKDQALIDSLNAGQDTHCFIASKIVEIVRQSDGAKEVLASMNLDDQYPLTYSDFANRDKIKETHKKYGEMLDKFRTAVKRVVFGILYGAGPQKIAETIGISLAQAQQLIDMLFTLFPSIKTYMAQTRWELQKFGFVETFFGRRRRFSVVGAPKYQLGRAERQTVNFKIQSTSSEIVMGRLVAVDGPLRDLGGRMLLTVHDSLGFQILKKYASQLPDFIYTHLEKGAADAHPWLPVAFKWDYEVGPSYGELKSLDAYLANTLIKEYSNDAAEAYTEEEVRTALAEV